MADLATKLDHPMLGGRFALALLCMSLGLCCGWWGFGLAEGRRLWRGIPLVLGGWALLVWGNLLILWGPW